MSVKRGVGVFFFFQHHRSFEGQIRIKANIKKVKSLKLTTLADRSSVTTLDAVPYSGGHWFHELTTFYSSKKRNEANEIQGTRQYISLN